MCFEKILLVSHINLSNVVTWQQYMGYKDKMNTIQLYFLPWTPAQDVKNICILWNILKYIYLEKGFKN